MMLNFLAWVFVANKLIIFLSQLFIVLLESCRLLKVVLELFG